MWKKNHSHPFRFVLMAIMLSLVLVSAPISVSAAGVAVAVSEMSSGASVQTARKQHCLAALSWKTPEELEEEKKASDSSSSDASGSSETDTGSSDPGKTDETPEMASLDTVIQPPAEKHLTKRAGVFMGPSGKETWYNMNMEKTVKRMRNMGYSEKDYPYWEREDGAKMLGNFVMVAAAYSLHPLGSVVETSMGTAIVVDTGGFAATNPTLIDIAVNW